jgi:glycosyltransferase involved in cell wall biosynthesis
MRRVVFVQPALPAYRVPFFHALALALPSELEVWCDARDRGSLRSAASLHSAVILRSAAGNGFTVRHWPERKLGPFFSQPALIQAALARNVDTLIFPWNSRYLELFPAIVLGRARGLRVLLWGHGYSKNESGAKRWVRNALGRLASGVVLYSTTQRVRLVAEGFSAGRAYVAQNALDRAPIAVAQGHVAGSAGPSDLPEEPTILFSSRLEPDKRPDLLLAAFALVTKEANAHLLIIGDGPLLHQLEAQSRALGVSDFVEFVGAEYEETRVAALMRRAMVFAYPAAIGLSLLHAFHYGLPVVTSDDIETHNPEIEALLPGQNGATFRDGDVADFARVLLELIADEPLRKRLSLGALETVTVESGFTLDNMVRGMLDAILERSTSNSA